MGKNPVRVVASIVVVSMNAGCITSVRSDPSHFEAQANITHVAAVTAAVASVVTLVIVVKRRPSVTTVVTERVVEARMHDAKVGPNADMSTSTPDPALTFQSESDGGFGARSILSGWALPDAVDAAENCDGGDLSACRNFALMTIHGLNGQDASPAGGCSLLRQLCGLSDSVSCSIAAEQCGVVE